LEYFTHDIFLVGFRPPAKGDQATQLRHIPPGPSIYRLPFGASRHDKFESPDYAFASEIEYCTRAIDFEWPQEVPARQAQPRLPPKPPAVAHRKCTAYNSIGGEVGRATNYI
jgi:hypothetical protein